MTAPASSRPGPRAGNGLTVSPLDGVWDVERVGGLLPPLVGVWKEIHGERGRTGIGPWAGVPFRVEGLTLRYEPPLSPLVDVLEPAGDGYEGRATVAGRTYGRFRLRRRGPVPATGRAAGAARGRTRS